MGRRKSQKNLESNSLRLAGDSSESGRSRDTSQGPEKKQCAHIKQAVDHNHNIRKHFKSSISVNHLVCSDCDSQEVSVCLRCGVSLCTNEHAKKHEQTPRSYPHCIMIDTNSWTVWCFKCNASIPLDANKRLRSTGDIVKSYFDKTPAPVVVSSVPIALGPPPPPPMPSSTFDKNDKKQFKQSSVKTNGKNGAAVPVKIRGLANLGNTCFFNSVLQCLAQTPNLVEYFNDLQNDGGEFAFPPIDEGDTETIVKLDGCGPLTQELSKTLSELKSGAGSVFSPRPLLERLRKKCSQFRGYEQHDAHELLRELLNAVRMEDLKRYQKVILMKMFKTTEVNPNDLDEDQKLKAKQMNQKISEIITTKPINIFKGLSECVHECQDCGYRSPKTEPFMDLSLPVLSEKPQPPSCKKSRGDSTSEEPKLSKHQLKKQRKNVRIARKRENHVKNNKKIQTGNASDKVNDPPESNKSGENDDDESLSCPYPRRQESGYNSDKLAGYNSDRLAGYSSDDKHVSPPRSSSPAIQHTAQAFMDYYSPTPNMLDHFSSLCRSKSSSFDEEFFGPPTLFDDIETAASKLENLNLSPSPAQEFLQNNLSQEFVETALSFVEDNTATSKVEKLNQYPELSQQFDETRHSFQENIVFDEEVCGYMSCPKQCFNEKIEADPYPPMKSLNELTSAPKVEVDCQRASYFNDRNYLALPNNCEPSITCINKMMSQLLSEHSTDNVCDLPGPSELTLESLKQNAQLNREEFSSDLGSRSSSLFHESGFCSQSIDEVSSTHPSEGMCSTESCNGVIFGDEFHVENKTSIPESGIGLSIPESDGEANTSPDSMHANRSSGSIQTLSPFSDDSSQRKNLLRSRNSLANLSNEDFSSYLQEHPSSNQQHCLDSNYIFEKLNSGRISRRDVDMEDEEELHGGDDEDEGGKNEEEGEEAEPITDCEYNKESSVRNGATLTPRTPRCEGECSLLSCLNQYTCIELLAGNNKVTCERCTRNHNRGTTKKDPVKTAATLQTLIVSPPSVLICHLKRFQLAYNSLKKISKSVPFPLTLSIGCFCSSNCQNITEGQTDIQYSLYGVVEHSGSLHGGHYVAYVKTSSGQWYYASDSRVSPVSESTVLKSEAYLLFYHRIC